MIHYEDFERERLDPIYDIIAPYSEMSKNERYFLNGMIRYFKPKKILEVGVSSGGGTALILNAISDIDGAELYSVDYSEKAYRHPEKSSGFLVEEQFPHLMDKWHIYRGGDVSRFIETVGGDIDMLVLDTVHIHPWETLNFLCVLPLMKLSGSWTILHDISLSGLACRYLFGHVVSEEKFSPAPDNPELPPNIGAFRISEDTMKYINNLFESLMIPFFSSEVPQKDFDSISAIIKKYYSPEQYKFFLEAFKFQASLKDRGYKERKKSFYESLKTFIILWQPSLYDSMRKIKRSIKK